MKTTNDIKSVPGFTYTRAGSATAWRKDGTLAEFAPNVPRITDRGVLIEGQRTNRMPRWDPTAAQIASKDNCVDVAAPTVAPLAGRNWIALDNSSAPGYLYQAVPVAASTVFTISVFVETVDGGQPVAGINATSGDFGFVLASDLVLSSAAYRRVAGNVWLVSVTATTKAITTGTNAGIVRYNGQSTRPLKFSGFQIEQASDASSPIITTGALVTRGADNLSLAKTIAAGEDFTVVVKARFTTAEFGRIFSWDAGSDADNIRISRRSDGTISFVAEVGGTQNSQNFIGPITGPADIRYAIRRSGRALTAIVNGGPISAAINIDMPTLTTIFVGRSRTAGVSFSETKSLTLFPYAVTDAELVEMTR